jgi:hypothetical protein
MMELGGSWKQREREHLFFPGDFKAYANGREEPGDS